MNQFARMAKFQHAVDRPGRPSRATSPGHRLLLAKVHLAAKELGLADDDYRGILFDETGKRSAKDCTTAELVRVVERFKARGWAQKPPKAPRPADHAAAMKARAMWVSLHHLCAIDNPSDQALEAFAKRQLKCERMQWANQGLMYRLIEALKAIAERHGWSQDMAGVRPEAVPLVLRRGLVEAILQKLRDCAFIPADWDFERVAHEFAGMRLSLILATASELDVIARVLGDQLREARGSAPEMVR